MKNICWILCLFISLTLRVDAQTVTRVQTKETRKITHTTKSGAPDKRFKENKTTKTTVASGPVKKDGTPDMRYKANKKTTVSVQTNTK